ncbi:centriole and centriolar satellite protein ofd1-like isoform X2 [Watersipora subatra]|uniref:centriole and centriolar satellite protein ofd1-like isoform X2 n=1 Tax=Watersipora subatra TaxID=2589382 RepID=UPI00355C93CA
MSAEEMRNVLYERLHNRGLLDTLKSQLRDYMVAELTGKASHPRQRPACLEQRLLDSLIYKYLCDMGCDYTVGIFLPESGITKREILSSEEMKELLSLPAAIQGRPEGSLLQLAVSSIMSSRGVDKVADRDTQTDSHALLLSDKLSDIDKEFSVKSQTKTTAVSVEERLLSHQRRVELACSQKSQQDFDRWKKLELETVRMTEREKVQREMQDRRRQLEDEYRKKAQALTEREKALTDSVKMEFESAQREAFQQRQQLLQQSEQLRHRDAEIREERNHLTRLQKANEEKLEKLEQMLRKRELEIEKKELHMDNTLRAQQERCKMEEQLAYDSRNRELKAWEEQLKDKESSLEREKRSILTNNERKELLDLRLSKGEMEKKIQKHTMEVSGLEMSIVGLQERLAKMFDYEVLKESNISLKKDLEMTKERLHCLTKEYHLLQEKYEQTIIDGKEKAGVGEIMLIKTHMQKERDKALDEKVLLEHRLKEMDARFHEQMRKNDAMVREFELQTDRQKYMNKEYSELRKHMGNSHGGSMRQAQTEISIKEPSFYDTSFRRSVAPELALDAEWLADVSSGAEVSTATEESIVTETRRRLDHLTEEAENLHSAFTSMTKSKGGYSACARSPVKSVKTMLTHSQAIIQSAVDMPVAAQYFTSIPSAPPTTHDSRTALWQPSHLLADETASDIVARSREAFQPPTYSQQSGDPVSQADQFNRPTPNKAVRPFQQKPIIQSVTSPPGQLSQPIHAGTSSSQSPMVVVENSPPLEPPAASVDAPLSLDSQWRAPKSLDSQWQAPLSLDSQWQTKPAASKLSEGQDEVKAELPSVPSSLDAQWKAKATSLDADKGPVEEQSSAGRSTDVQNTEDKMAGIDPVMQRYMTMIQQQKEKKPVDETKEKKSTALKDVEEESISEHISLARSDKDSSGAATDDNFW